MGGGDAEQGVDRVADVLLNGPALGGDEGGELGEGAIERPFHTLRPERLRQRREAHDVDEERGDDSPLQPLLAHAPYLAAPAGPRSSPVSPVVATSRPAGVP